MCSSRQCLSPSLSLSALLSGIIMTSWPNMDREARDEYLVVVQVKDMLGLSGGYSSSTTVTVSLTDVNDNAPIFQHRESPAMHAQSVGRCFILHLRGTHVITPLSGSAGWFVPPPPPPHSSVHISLFSQAAKTKRSQWEKERGQRWGHAC